MWLEQGMDCGSLRERAGISRDKRWFGDESRIESIITQIVTKA